GHTVTLAYPLVVNNGVAPVLDLNGAATGNNNTVAANTGSTQPVHLAGPASGAYLTLPTVQLGNDLTLEAWVNFSALSNWARVFDIGSSQTDNLILAIQSDGRVSSSIRVGATAVTVDSVVDATHPALLAGQWYHMALVVSGSTQKVYVNGIEWLSGNLPAGFSGSTVTRRSTTLIGKSAWGDPLATMQIRDVRVFDDARTLGELSADAAAITALDTQDPHLRLAYALHGNLQSSLPSGTAATPVSLAQADIPQDVPQLLAPVATLTSGNNVASVRVVLGGLQDGAAEKLSVGSSAIAADASVSTGTVDVGTTTWNWTFAADLATSSGTFTLSAPTGGVSSAVAQDLLQRLAYSNISSTPHSGNRVFSITATDIFGTPSASVSATVDASLPGISNLPTQPQGVAAAIASDLVDLVFTKGGSTSASDVLKLTVLATGA
ncbi:MAG: LamG domain-containing protein, partial [Rhodoferax sp.]|nr:LamG domain-containing protein [Rhodoferax sp.]